MKDRKKKLLNEEDKDRSTISVRDIWKTKQVLYFLGSVAVS